MPRKKRLSVTGAIHHIMARGIDGRDLFNDDDDRSAFLNLLTSNLQRTGFSCLAWALMRNHYHLLIRINDLPLSALMRTLNSKYARYHAREYERRGYLFQDRFKSIATQDQGYIEELVRYVHLNPIRAGVCKDLNELDNYPWSGHSAIMGVHRRPFQDVRQVLKRFGDRVPTARKRYREFLDEGLTDANEDDLLDQIRASNRDKQNRFDHGCWVIGDREFVAKALAMDEENRLRIARYARTGWTIEKLSTLVARHFGISIEELKIRGRQNEKSDARKSLAYLATRRLGIHVSEIAGYLGVSNTAISRLSETGAIVAARQKIVLPDSPP